MAGEVTGRQELLSCEVSCARLRVATRGGIHSVIGSRGENSWFSEGSPLRGGKGGVLSYVWHFSALPPAPLSMLQGGVQIRNDIFSWSVHIFGKTRSLEGLLQLVRGECRGHWRVATDVSFGSAVEGGCATSFGPSMGSWTSVDHKLS